MKRSSQRERALRINAALALIQKGLSLAAVATRLLRTYGVSRRQAYRYINEAQKAEAPVSVPEEKGVLTVKLPVSLIRRLRKQAEGGGKQSDIVTAALKDYLSGRRTHG